MKNRPLLALVLAHALLVSVAGQSPTTQTPTQKREGAPQKDDVVRITSNLVQVDAVVTDKKGQPVTDLRPEDFEIYEDGRSQKITNFSFVSVEPGAQPATESAAARTHTPSPLRAASAPPRRGWRSRSRIRGARAVSRSGGSRSGRLRRAGSGERAPRPAKSAT